MSDKQWFLFCYDIRDQRRWRQVYKHLQGSGDRLQYSLFRCRLTRTQMEALRWEVERELDDEDDLLIIQLSPRSKIIERQQGARELWKDPPERFEIY